MFVCFNQDLHKLLIHKYKWLGQFNVNTVFQRFILQMLKESEGKNCQEIAKEGSSLESEQSPIICHLGSETKKLSC